MSDSSSEDKALSELGSSPASPSPSTALTLLSSSETSHSASTSPTITMSSITEVDSEADFPKGEVVIFDEVANGNRLSLVFYKPVFESTELESKGVSVQDMLANDVLDDEDDNLSMILYQPIVDALIQQGGSDAVTELSLSSLMSTTSHLDHRTCNFDLPSLANALGLCLPDANIFLQEFSFISPHFSGLQSSVRTSLFIKESKLSRESLVTYYILTSSR